MSSLKIYTEFFGLNKRPFTLLPDPEFIYWSTPHKQAFTMLEYGLLTCAPITLITGEIGSGKTTLLRELLKTMPHDYVVGLISNAQGDRGELLHWVLMSLGQPVAPGMGYVQLFHQLQNFLIDTYAKGKRTVLIFDEAQNLSPETLEELRMFSNINADTDELLQLILMGQPELCDLVARPDLVQFAQRIAAEFHLPTMSADDVENYITHRLEVAGATTPIFSKGACDAIHLVSKGTPRLVNQICDYALVYAYSYERRDVDARIIQQVIMDRKIYGVFHSTQDGQTPFNSQAAAGLAPMAQQPPAQPQAAAPAPRPLTVDAPPPHPAPPPPVAPRAAPPAEPAPAAQGTPFRASSAQTPAAAPPPAKEPAPLFPARAPRPAAAEQAPPSAAPSAPASGPLSQTTLAKIARSPHQGTPFRNLDPAPEPEETPSLNGTRRG